MYLGTIYYKITPLNSFKFKIDKNNYTLLYITFPKTNVQINIINID